MHLFVVSLQHAVGISHLADPFASRKINQMQPSMGSASGVTIYPVDIDRHNQVTVTRVAEEGGGGGGRAQGIGPLESGLC